MRYSLKTFGFLLLIFLTSVDADREKSLFDDLPLNGAYNPDEDPVSEDVKLSANAKSTLSDSLFLVRSRKTKENKSADFSANVDYAESKYENKEPASLFDEMPNQGAMSASVPSGDLNVSESNLKRSFLHPDLLIRSDVAAKGLHYEIERQEPTGEFTLADFERNLVPPIVQSLARPDTVFPPVVQSHNHRTSGPLVLTHPVPKNAFKAIPVRSNSGRQAGNPASVIIYGSLAPALAAQRETVTNKEVHHYHFRGPPRSRVKNLEPPRADQPASGYNNHQNRRTSFTGSSGGYGPSITTPQPPRPQQTIITTTQAPTQPQTDFPIITYPDDIGGSVSAGGGSTLADSVGDYDYESLDFRPPPRGRQFSSRTGSGTITLGFGSGGRGGQRNSYNNEPQQQFSPPAETYGPPHPSPSYGPPAPDRPQPPPSYGPPLESDFPVVEPPAPPPKNTGTTSISYQTIPIQTVHTQLITVPHVTVSSSSDSQSDSSASSRPQRPGRPVSIAYGAPSGTRSNSFSNTPDNTGNTATENLFSDDQIAALLSVAGSGGGGNQFGDDDSLATLLAGSVRGGGNNLFGGRDILGGRNIIGGGDILGGRNILGGGDILGGNVLGGDLGLQLGGHRSIFSHDRIRGNGNRDGQLLSALLNQQRGSDGLLANRNPLTIPTRGFRNQPVLTGDAVDAVSDLIREQRLRGAIQDLTGRLRHQNRNAQRANEKYRSLFYKGALLLSALTLIPAVASPIAAAATGGVSANSFLLPLASGRRKREVGEIDQHTSPFEICKWLSDADHNNGVGFNSWFNCALNATESMFHKISSTEFDEIDPMVLKVMINPETIRKDLQETLSPDDIRKNSECLQKRFCETVLEAEVLSDAETLLLLYSIFGKDIENNPWIRGSITAARNKDCSPFFCF